MKPKISVIIPAIRLTENITKNINKLLQLSYVTEIIIINNGIGKSFQQLKHECVYVIKSKVPFNASAARNLGVVVAKEELLLFIDQDTLVKSNSLLDGDIDFGKWDIIVPKLEIEFKVESKMRASYRQNHCRVTRGTGISLSRRKIVLPNFNSACFLCKKELFHKVGGFNTLLRRYEDRFWMKELASFGVSAICLDHFVAIKNIDDKNWLTLQWELLQELFYRIIANRLEKNTNTKSSLTLIKHNKNLHLLNYNKKLMANITFDLEDEILEVIKTGGYIPNSKILLKLLQGIRVL